MSGERAYCASCHRDKLLCGAKWHRKDGQWDEICRTCRDKRLRVEKQGMEREAVSKVMRIASGKILKSANVPHSAELLGELMDIFGGPRKFAERFIADMDMTDPQGMIRAQYNRAVVQLVKDVTAQGGAKKPVDDMDLAELDEEIQNYVMKLYRPGDDGEARQASA